MCLLAISWSEVQESFKILPINTTHMRAFTHLHHTVYTHTVYTATANLNKDCIISHYVKGLSAWFPVSPYAFSY